MTVATKNPWGDYSVDFWNKRPELAAPAFEALAEWIVGYRTTLEVGCGVGRLSEMLPASQLYVGIDLPSEANAEAQARYGNSSMRWPPCREFLCGDFRTDLPERRFDLSVACHVLDHLPHFERGLAVLFEVTDKRVVTMFANPLSDVQVIRYRSDGCYNNSYCKQDVVDYADYCGWKVTVYEEHNRYTDHEQLSSLVVFDR